MSEHSPIRKGPVPGLPDLSKDAPGNPLGPQGRRMGCAEWERLLADALDGLLPAAGSAAFEQHRQECAACAQMLEEARQGIAWLGYLESDPPVPVDLMARILARTSGPAAIAPATRSGIELAFAHPSHAWYRTVLPAARLRLPLARMIEPRMWMTAAMAFFSIALTLNLIGIRLSAIRLADMRPSVVLTNATRQYYSTKEEGVKYYDNLRFVYEMEARVRELRRSQGSAPAPLPEDTPRQQAPSSLNKSPGRKTPAPAADGDSLAVGAHSIRTQGTRTQAERSLV